MTHVVRDSGKPRGDGGAPDTDALDTPDTGGAPDTDALDTPDTGGAPDIMSPTDGSIRGHDLGVHDVHSALYRGELVHARNDVHVRRAFRYGVYMAALDLDELPELDRRLRLFSLERPNVFAFRERDYRTSLSPCTDVRAADLCAELAGLRAANGLPVPARTRLVTNLRAFGYLFNPVSFFLDYDAAGALVSVIAEVNNTYGGRLRYVLGPRDRLSDTGADGVRVGFRHVRELFVSPFLHGPATYEFWFDAPCDGDAIEIAMHVRDAADERVFTARFRGRRAALSDRTLAHAALRYPVMTARVIGLIHWQALKLRLAGAPYRAPAPDHRPIVGDHRISSRHARPRVP